MRFELPDLGVVSMTASFDSMVLTLDARDVRLDESVSRPDCTEPIAVYTPDDVTGFGLPLVGLESNVSAACLPARAVLICVMELFRFEIDDESVDMAE